MSSTVNRKPVDNGRVQRDGPAMNPPYPDEPIRKRPPYPDIPEPRHYSPSTYIPQSTARPSSSRSSSVSSHGTWNSDSDNDHAEQLPHQAHSSPILGSNEPWSDQLPQTLQPGNSNNLQSPLPTQDQPLLDSQAEWQTHVEPDTTLHRHSIDLLQHQSPLPPDIDLLEQPLWNDQSQLQHLPSHPISTSTDNTTDTLPSAELARHHLQEQSLADDKLLSAPIPPHIDRVQSSDSLQRPLSKSTNPWQHDLDRQNLSHLPQPPTIPSESTLNVWESARNSPAPPTQVPTLPSRSNLIISTTSRQRPTDAQRKESYQIKHINWQPEHSLDSGPGTNTIRRTPILVQNINGPCPLLALVNAVLLNTPPSIDSSILQALQSREQITLGTLLDALFDELIRTNESSGSQLPDMDDFYAFLMTLHSGMNVNPLFINGPSSPGTFEQTSDIQLYNTFSIPLVHGWIMPSHSSEHAAFARTAQSYDEAQNVQFREDELEEKATYGQLSVQEEQMAEDVLAIKRFLATNPTQLTEYGLDVLSRWLQPGQVAVLFRNDHFSTLYKHPRNNTLVALVTDEGYLSHDEIIWETTVDVSGSGSEFLSGDFRPVSIASADLRSPGTPYTRTSQPQQDFDQPLPSTEQEDADLAMAMQLQDEEDERNRADADRRRREEEELSRRYIFQEQGQSPQQTPQSPPNQSHTHVQTPAAQNVSPTNATGNAGMVSSARTDGDTAPPPPYEQASSDRPYREDGSTPVVLATSSQSGSANAQGQAPSLPGRQSNYANRPPGIQAQTMPGSMPYGSPQNHARPTNHAQRPDQGDCLVM